jgi:decaprenylphospho-beta-D-erythro-pentofuranosid-2-ulose 2-reductase
VSDALLVGGTSEIGLAIERAFADAGGFDVVVIAVGVLGAQAGLDADPDEAIEVMRVNFLGTGSVYGAAKAGLDALAQGLSDAIASNGVRVLVVRPGFVKTRMTAGLEAAPFATTPEVVASAMVAALRGNAGTIWVPGRLRLMFAIVRHLPRRVYRRLPL